MDARELEVDGLEAMELNSGLVLFWLGLRKGMELLLTDFCVVWLEGAASAFCIS